jgi:hypothetical protein
MGAASTPALKASASTFSNRMTPADSNYSAIRPPHPLSVSPASEDWLVECERGEGM